MGYQFDFNAVWKWWPVLLDGTLNTIYFTLVSIAIGLVLAVLIMLARMSSITPLRMVARIFIEAFRNTPFLVQLFFIYFGLPSIGIRLPIEVAAISALSVNVAAYLAEILRGGVEALPKGQVEAAKALGLNRTQTFFDVVLKPSLRAVYPGLCGQFILLLLMSSIVSTISAQELTYSALYIESRNFRSIEIFLVVTCIYLIMSVTFSSMLRLFGRMYFSYPEK